MIGLAHRFVAASAVEVLSLGPVQAGLVIRGIWVCATGATTLFADLALAVCGSEPRSLEDVQAGRQVVVSSDAVIAQLGVPSLAFNLSAGLGQSAELPCYVAVPSGPIWIGVAAFSTSAFKLTLGLRVGLLRGGAEEVELLRPGRSKQGVGDVMDSLREAAANART